ncbi:uncharacterized protein FIBRA_09271 [Fibroporia radiculosa]|uniref:Uncharacterized protein n=1 Tax=Fibroporia radiculosa TaxID=599839 RepID=J7RHA5_9APHY|nr:uncharacterized protein FIBRA_09271 [Fibroporia radiculosa]CCM06957.1 predicted protein [Fibroporia radiculosa]
MKEPTSGTTVPTTSTVVKLRVDITLKAGLEL